MVHWNHGELLFFVRLRAGYHLINMGSGNEHRTKSMLSRHYTVSFCTSYWQYFSLRKVSNIIPSLAAETKMRKFMSHFNKCSKSRSKFTKDSKGENIFICDTVHFERRSLLWLIMASLQTKRVWKSNKAAGAANVQDRIFWSTTEYLIYTNNYLLHFF